MMYGGVRWFVVVYGGSWWCMVEVDNAIFSGYFHLYDYVYQSD
jgi:hypothetical protein